MRKRVSKILITGAAGFMGSEFSRQAIKRGYKVIAVDKLSYAADLARLGSAKGRFKFYKTDICDKAKLKTVFKKEKPKIVVNFAAETHVDRSILNAEPFIQTNVRGTQVLLDISRQLNVEKFIHISTDEIYGEIKKGKFSENSPLKPNSPYSATKAASDMLVSAYHRTYKLPSIIVRPSNNYGPWQYPEKLMPVIIAKALKNEKVPVYGKGENVREWLYVSDCAEGIFSILRRGEIGEVYNIGSAVEKKNIVTVKKILSVLGKPHSLIKFVKDRPGHDIRYSLDFSKIRKHTGWTPKVGFDKGIHNTVDWYRQNYDWLSKKVKYLRHYWGKVYR